MKILILLLFFQFSTQYGIMSVEKGKWKQIGYATIYNDILWLKFDLEKAEEFKVIFTEKRPALTTYYIKNEKAYGSIAIDDQYIYINLFIKGTKQHYDKKFTRRNDEISRN